VFAVYEFGRFDGIIHPEFCIFFWKSLLKFIGDPLVAVLLFIGESVER
jgi:hypothetical protein